MSADKYCIKRKNKSISTAYYSSVGMEIASPKKGGCPVENWLFP